MAFCIPKNLVAQLKNSALKGEVDIAKLYDMSSVERRDFFSKHAGEDLGKFINTEFEKAMISKQKSAITEWAKSVFTPEAKAKPVYKTVLDKIKTLDDMGVLTPETEKAFLEDLVADRLGINVSAQEVKAISARAEKIDAAQKKIGNDLGIPSEANFEFFKAKAEMDNYLQSLAPASNLKVATGTIGRGMMLASVKSPLLNIGSNIELAFTETLSRRLAGGSVKGTDNALAIDYVKNANKVYQKTGYDISRMTSLSDSGASGQRVLGDTVHAKGPGAVRKVGRFFEDVVFKQLMGAPDVAFSASHFADSVNLNSLKMAKGDVKLARSMMEDSMRITPQTEAGELLRAQGILDAQTATWTNTTWASKASEGIRKVLNDVSGDIRVGDFVMPFVKTPANVIATGMDYAGLGGVKALVKTVKAMRSGELESQSTMQGIARDLVRSGLGLTGAYVIASQLKDDDFVGAYDPARAQMEKLRGSNWNSIRVGDKWISTAWLGPIAVPVTAIMYARKYGKTKPEMVFQYGRNVVNQSLEIPGISDARDYFKSSAYKQNKTLEEATGEAADYAISEAVSRLTPGIMSDTAKALDPFDRETKNVPKDASWYEKFPAVQQKVPFWREKLPVKKNIFGEEVKGEGAISDIGFGARVKTDKETPITQELRKISEAVDKPINFTDWSRSSSNALAQFKEKVGDKAFEESQTKYGQELKSRLERYFKSFPYQNHTDEQKHKVVISIDSDAQEKVFREYHFRPKKAKSVRLRKE